jgi:proline iminopeptidase
MELLRHHLNVTQWVLFGGSWGSTLALAYAQHHPSQCLGLILRGIFLCRKFEIDWFLYGMRVIFPEMWQEFSHYIPKEERHDLLQAYHRLLMNPDPNIYIPAAKMWSKYEGACATLMPSPETVAAFLDETLAIGLARLEAHYFLNDIFLPENFLLDNIHRIRHLPAVIIQGRYDIVCPMVTAQEVHEAWPEAEYIIVPDAGHSAFDFALCQELVDACDRFKAILQ